MIWLYTTIVLYLVAGFFFSNIHHLRTRKRRAHLIITWLPALVGTVIALLVKPKKHIE